MNNAHLELASRWLHILSAITLLGGSIFSLAVLLPAAKELTEPEHDKLKAAVLQRWKRFVHSGIAMLFLSGLINFVRGIYAHKGLTNYGLYHLVINTKIVLAIAIFLIASLLVGRTSAAVAMRKNAKLWMSVIVALGVTVVILSGYAKVMVPGRTTVNTAPAE